MAMLRCDVIGCFERAEWLATGHADMPAMEEYLCAYHYRRVCKMHPQTARLYRALDADASALAAPQEKSSWSKTKFHLPEDEFRPLRRIE